MFSMLDNPRQDFRVVTRDLEHVVGCFGPDLDECDHLSLLTRDSSVSICGESVTTPGQELRACRHGRAPGPSVCCHEKVMDAEKSCLVRPLVMRLTRPTIAG
jgi:hypothetical protein